MNTTFKVEDKKKNILNRLRNKQLRNKKERFLIKENEATTIYPKFETNRVDTFRDELQQVSGFFYHCHNDDDLQKSLQSILQSDKVFCNDRSITKQLEQFGIPFSNKESDFLSMKIGLTACEYLVARRGSVLVSSALPTGRRLHAYAPIHIVVAHENQLVPELEDALDLLQKKYTDNFPSVVTTITGASRTADIEKTLIMGAHGPKELHVILIAQ